MTDIVKSGPTIVKQAVINGKKPTLQSLNRDKSLSVKRSVFILADISGSMCGQKLESLKDALRRVYRPGITVYAFSNDTYEVQQSDFLRLEAFGNTYMLGALREAWIRSPTHIILITDGQPTDANEDEILTAASMHKDIPIDTIGISEYARRGFNAQFLMDLSAITGGKFNDCSRPLELTNIIETLLLTAGTQSEGGSIQL